MCANSRQALTCYFRGRQGDVSIEGPVIIDKPLGNLKCFLELIEKPTYRFQESTIADRSLGKPQKFKGLAF